MRRLKLLIMLITILLSQSSLASKMTEVNWQQAATEDLNKIHQILQQNSAFPIVKPAANIKRWYEPGFKLALQQLTNVHDYADYCRVLKFYVDGMHSEHLSLSFLPPSQAKAAQSLSIHRPTEFTIEPFAKNGVWLTIPTFRPDSAKVHAQLEKVINQMPNLRHKAVIVLDIRGNHGGDADYFRRLLRSLYTDEYLQSLGGKFLWQQPWQSVWRVTAANIDYLSQLANRVADAEELASFVHKLQQAANQKLATFVESQWILPRAAQSVHQALKNPVTAKVIFVTDEHCASSCWLFCRDLRAIPGTWQLGQATDAMDKYTIPRTVTIRQDIAKLNFPMMAFLTPLDHFGQRFVPQVIFRGDIADTNAVKRWVERLINSKVGLKQ